MVKYSWIEDINMKQKICLIIPSYNEEKMIDTLYHEITKVVNDIEGYDFTLLFVDDGSKDQTLALVKNHAISDTRVKYVSFSRNYGKEAAMLAGLEYAQKLNADAAIFMDADMQDPPVIIKDFLKYYEEGYKYIYTRNRNRKGQGFLKKFFSVSFYKVYRILTKEKNVISNARDFALLDKDVINAFLSYKDTRRYSKGIASQMGFKNKVIEYDFNSRIAGETKWSFRKLFKYAMVGIEQFSRIYEIVPNILLILLFFGLGVQIGFAIAYPDIYRWLFVAITGGVFLIVLVLKFIMKVLYDIRDQQLGRPQYLTEETNVIEK